jgi:hypothetical protein
MSKPGALIPHRGKEIALTTSANTAAPVRGGFRVRVTTPGVINAVYKNSDTTCRLSYDAGTHFEPGHFKELWTDGTIVLDPATIIVEVAD